MDAHPLLTTLSAAERADALARFHQLQPFLEEGVPLPQLAATAGIPLRTARRWVARYRQRGLAGLVRQRRADQGHRRFPPELVQLVEGLALRRPRPTVATIQRQVATVAQREGWPVPSYSTVYAVVRTLDPALMTLAQDGPAAYRDRFELVSRRDAPAPNAIWQADHTQLDCWVGTARERPAKPWLTVILDDYSRAVAGYRLSLAAPSALQTALALRDAIWRKAEPAWHLCGIPAVFYTDHGSDFTSQHLEQVALDLHIQLICSTAGVPRGRGKIERFFQTITQLFLATQPGYAPEATPAPAAASLLPLSELDARLGRFLVGDYHQRPHRETGTAPQARWDAGGFLPRLPESLEQLDLLLLTVAKARTVQRDGIHFQGLRYLDLTLAAYIGEPVTIRYDPRDLGEIRVYHQERFLCRAICPELAGTSIGLKDLQQARQARRRQLQATLGERGRLVDLLLGVHTDAPPPVADPAPPQPRLKRYANE